MVATSALVGVRAGVGMVEVESSGPFGHLLRRVVGLPLRGRVHRAQLDVAPTVGGGERWTRRFGDQHRRSVCSRLRPIDEDTVTERFGAVCLTFDVEREPGVAGPRMTLVSTTIGAIRLGRRWLAVDVFVASPEGADEATSHVRTRVLGGRFGRLDYSVVMTSSHGHHGGVR